MHQEIYVSSTASNMELIIELMLKFTDYICDTILHPVNISCPKHEKELYIEIYGTEDEWSNMNSCTKQRLVLYRPGGYWSNGKDKHSIYVLCTSYVECIEIFLHEAAHRIGHATMDSTSEGFASFAHQIYMYPPDMYSRYIITDICNNINDFNISHIFDHENLSYRYTVSQLILDYYYQRNTTQFHILLTKYGTGYYWDIIRTSIVPNGPQIELHLKKILSKSKLAHSFSYQFTRDLEEIDEYFYRTKMILDLSPVGCGGYFIY